MKTYKFTELSKAAQERALELVMNDIEYAYDSEYNRSTEEECRQEIIRQEYEFSRDGREIY